ncbi:MAG: S1/P1 Nuclease [Flavobacteriales bacterium CG_4_9_14_3_um_filter_40_17]|nr:MAG: S1/P1 Nuclease [Flavobacteriales bacterium CG_4_9_14_3_um_filter_40_17]
MRSLLFFFAFVFSTQFSLSTNLDWGKTGHRVVGELAEQNLSKRAQRKIDKILNGQSLAFVSTYADDIKSDRRYKKYDVLHYVNFPLDKNYSDQPANENGDIIKGIQECIAILKNPNTTESDQTFYLKLLIHFIGDLHQPMHIGQAEDKGGNNIQVQWFGKGSNLHRVWDSEMIDGYNMSYTELTENLPAISKEGKKQIMQSDLIDWVAETREVTKKIYASVHSGDKLGYNYSYDYFDTVRIQLQKAGLRLAKILNEIYL